MNSPFGGLKTKMKMPDAINTMKSVYLIGIGGIGMSALARFFRSTGAKVSGYDRAESPLTRQLMTEGIDVHFDEDVSKIPKDADLVIYTPAVPAGHRELVYYMDHHYKVMKRSDVLQLITQDTYNICVAGTHGKTTTTTMIAHLLRDSGFACNAFLGGISVNYGTNFWSQDGGTPAVSVVEADEYDRSFLKLSPDVAVVTAMDPDHLDIYGTAGAMEEAFIDFTKKIRPGGVLIAKFGLHRSGELDGSRKLTYSLQNDSADAFAKNIRMNNGSYEFDVEVDKKEFADLTLHMGGMHNVENAVAAIAVAKTLDIEAVRIRQAIGNFKGVRRRFEYIIRNERLVFIDDYAHHPEELRALITGAKSLFPQRKCTVIFQPHLYSRTKDLAEGFAASLDLADAVVLLPIYPARELPLPGVNSEMIIGKMKLADRRVVAKHELINWVEREYMPSMNTEFGEVLITAGAGDIDALVEPLKNALQGG
ncbi:MAG TPA: UDP-N-acetylmuramate--L-alanine ligase [Chitinophagaceae bacterium]